jgi:hypothetical protein
MGGMSAIAVDSIERRIDPILADMKRRAEIAETFGKRQELVDDAVD